MKKHDNRNRATRDFGAGMNKVTYTLPLGGYLQELIIALRGDVVVADPGGGAAGTAIGENPGALVRRVIVEAVPKDGSPYPKGKIVNLSARSILRQRIFDTGTFLGDLVTPAGIDGTAKTTSIYQEFYIPFALPCLKKPVDTALNTNEYKSITVTIETGGRDTLRTGNTMNWDFSGLFFDFEDRREDMAGDTHVVFQEDHEIQILAPNKRLQPQTLPAGGNYLDLLFMAQATNDALADTILDTVEVSGSAIDFEKTALDLKAENFRTGASTAQTCTGLYHVAFSPDGLLYGAVPVQTAQDLALTLGVKNPSGAGLDSLLVRTRRVYWPENYRGK